MPHLLERPAFYRHPARRLRALLLCALTACGGGADAFTTTYPDDLQEPVERVHAALKARPAQPGLAVAVGASLDNRRVFAFDLETRRMLWTLDAAPSSPPLVAGQVVAIHEPGRVRLVALRSGQVIEDREDRHMALMGAAGDGALAAIVMSTGGSVGARSSVWILRDGRIESEVNVGYALGAPAVAGGLIFVPWNNVFLSVLEPTGREVTRVRIRAEVVSRAFAQDGDVYFGQLGLFRFDPALLAHDQDPAVYFRPQRDALPGRPAFLPAANKPPPPVQSALHRVKLSFRADPGPPLGLEGDHLFLSFYQQVFALHPSEARTDWVYSHDRDIVGMQASAAGLWLADETGQVTLLDAQGVPRFQTDLGIDAAVVEFRPGDFRPPLSPAEAPMPLADQLAAAAMHPDARLVPSRAMAVEMLGPVEGEAATAHLIALCADAESPPRVHDAACTTLGQRTEGPGPVLEALGQHADYLTQTPPPPVGPLAQAAMHMGLNDALPLLLAHLDDPATPVEHLPPLMDAIKHLADERAEQPVHAFLMLYHAYEEDPALLQALELSMDTLATRRGAAAAPTLELIANDGLGLPPLRGYAAQLLSTLPKPEPEGNEAEDADALAEGETEDESTDPVSEATEPAEPPSHLDARHVERTLSPVMNELRSCLRDSPKHPMTARLTIVVDGEGNVILVRSLPEHLLPCLRPPIQGVTFPANKFARRQQLTYRLSR